MASGKTTLGRPLAAALGRPFVDIDEAVESAAGMSVKEIFRSKGETAFRALESEVLKAAARGGAVVACGGGTPCPEENLAFMLDSGLVVELKASPATTLRRLQLAPGQRPLVDSLLDRPDELAAKVAEMLAAREPFYSRAHRTFCSDRLETAEEIAESVKSFIDQILDGRQNGLT